MLLRPTGGHPAAAEPGDEIEFADATTALWSENAGAHPAGATLSTDFNIQNVRVLASQVVLDSALVESFNRVLLSGRSLVFSYPGAHELFAQRPDSRCRPRCERPLGWS